MSTRARIVEILLARADFVSGTELATLLGVSRAAVWKHIAVLKRAGHEIESIRSRGYRLIRTADLLREEVLHCHLRTKWLGRRLVVRERTGSTNTDAALLGRRGAVQGTVVVAEEQTAGRGRLGRSWISAPKVNLYLSVLLRPNIVPAEAPQLALVTGVAVASALEREGLSPHIKWPNDVLVDGRKIAGVLTEIEAEADRVRFVVVGIGVNLNSTLEHFPVELRGRATSVALCLGRHIHRARFAGALLLALEELYDRFFREGFAAVAQDWEKRAVLNGQWITVSGAGEDLQGVCVGIDGDGALLLRQEGRERPRRILAGDVTMHGSYPQ